MLQKVCSVEVNGATLFVPSQKLTCDIEMKLKLLSLFAIPVFSLGFLGCAESATEENLEEAEEAQEEAVEEADEAEEDERL